MEALRDCFMDSCLKRGENTAITFLREGKVETEISYREMNQDSNRMANTFIELGVEKGDRVILFFEKSLFFVIAHLALQKIGAVSVPLSTGFKPTEMSYLLENANPKLVLLGTEQEAMIKEIAPSLANVVINTLRSYQDIDFFRLAPELMS